MKTLFSGIVHKNHHLSTAGQNAKHSKSLQPIQPINGSYSMAWAHKLLNGSPILEAGIKKLVDSLLDGMTAADGRPFFQKSRGAFAAIVAAATNRMLRDNAGADWVLKTAVNGARVGMERFIAENPNSLKIGEVKLALEEANKFLLGSGE